MAVWVTCSIAVSWILLVLLLSLSLSFNCYHLTALYFERFVMLDRQNGVTEFFLERYVHIYGSLKYSGLSSCFDWNASKRKNMEKNRIHEETMSTKKKDLFHKSCRSMFSSGVLFSSGRKGVSLWGPLPRYPLAKTGPEGYQTGGPKGRATGGTDTRLPLLRRLYGNRVIRHSSTGTEGILLQGSPSWYPINIYCRQHSWNRIETRMWYMISSPAILNFVLS